MLFARRAALATITWLASGCAPGFRSYVAPSSEAPCTGRAGAGGVRARYARNGCDGYCPVFRATLCGDGTVVYDGMTYVKVSGRHTRKLPPSALGSLVATLDGIPAGPTPLEDAIGASSPHLLYWRDGTPRWLARRTARGDDTAQVFELASGILEWIGTAAERERLWQESR